jgi:hypothetical protein
LLGDEEGERRPGKIDKFKMAKNGKAKMGKQEGRSRFMGIGPGLRQSDQPSGLELVFRSTGQIGRDETPGLFDIKASFKAN